MARKFSCCFSGHELKTPDGNALIEAIPRRDEGGLESGKMEGPRKSALQKFEIDQSVA